MSDIANYRTCCKAYLKDRTPNTRRAYNRHLRRFEDWPSCEELVAVLRSLNGSNQRQLLGALRGVARLGMVLDLLLFEFETAEEIPPKRGLNRAEAVKLCEACQSQKEEGVVIALLVLGIRRAELAGARWKGTKLEIVGKGGKRRLIAVPAGTPVTTGISEKTVYRIVCAVAKRAGFPAVTPHWLRHTHAQLARSAGADVVAIADQLGHGRLETTLIYTGGGSTAETVGGLLNESGNGKSRRKRSEKKGNVGMHLPER